MAKKRTINEIRQTKEYYTGNDPVKQIMAQQIDEELEECPLDPVEEAKSSPCANHDSERPKEFSEIYQEVANKVIDDIEDQLFELINEYSDDYDELYWNRYLTDDAPFELLDAAFENYHEHYNEIFKIIMSKLNE